MWIVVKLLQKAGKWGHQIQMFGKKMLTNLEPAHRC